MSDNRKERLIQRIKRIQEQQNKLQREQENLITQLEQLSIQDTQESEHNNNNELSLGDKVRIINPGRYREREGTICNIGKSRITVLTKKGNKIVRIPSNLKKL